MSGPEWKTPSELDAIIAYYHHKVNLKDLSREPQAQAAGTTPEVAPEPAPASAGSGSDEAWDSEWPDQ
jgi:hypothetical protein